MQKNSLKNYLIVELKRKMTKNLIIIENFAFFHKILIMKYNIIYFFNNNINSH